MGGCGGFDGGDVDVQVDLHMPCYIIIPRTIYILNRQLNFTTMLTRLTNRPCLLFSTTLQILTRNKTSLQPQLKNNRYYPIQQHKTIAPSASPHKLLPYMHMSHEYIQSARLSLINQFKELDVFKNKLLPNQALANGEDFQQYPLMKVIQICLKHKSEGNEDEKLWGRLESRVKELFRNTSAVENILLFYIAMGRFSLGFQSQLLKEIKIEYKSFTPMQRQLLFYSICHLKYKDNQLSPQLNLLKEELLASIHKSKLTIASLTQWILMIAIANATNLNSVLKYYDKVFLYEGQKYQITPEQFFSLMNCLQMRAVLTEEYELAKIREKGRKVIQFYLAKVPNSTMMINTSPQHLKIKMILNYCNPTPENLLTNQQFLNSTLSSSQKLMYLYWVWKNQKIQIYQLKSLYESIQINEPNHNQRSGFYFVDLVYYVCTVELALGEQRNYGWVIDKAGAMDYIPSGLQWILWNYLAYVAKGKVLLTTQQKNQVEQIIKKISSCSSTHDKLNRLAANIQTIKSAPQIQQLIKFFHSIKVWTFTACQPIGKLDQIAHFINQEMKIILHCLRREDFVEIRDSHADETQNRINNRHALNKKILKDNFGYEVIDIRVEQFMALNYGERVDWLRKKIGQKIRVADKFIEK